MRGGAEGSSFSGGTPASLRQRPPLTVPGEAGSPASETVTPAAPPLLGGGGGGLCHPAQTWERCTDLHLPGAADSLPHRTGPETQPRWWVRTWAQEVTCPMWLRQ